MINFIVRRLFWTIPVLFFVALVTFFLMHQAPGGPFDRDDNRAQADAATLKALEAYFGLDKPQYVNPREAGALWDSGERNPLTLGRAYLDSQFFNYLINAAHGDLGPSYRQRGKRVQQILATQWPYSIRLGAFALIFALVAGVPLGMIAGLKQNTLLDYLSLFCATIGVAVPTFISGLLVIIVFGTTLNWISITSNDWQTFTPYIAPGLVLGFATMSFIMRLTRAAMLEIKRQDYIRTARAKGLPERSVIARHMLRNGLIPVITLLGPALVNLVTGAVITEAVFGVPGVGMFFVNSIFQRDYSMIMGTSLLLAALIVFANMSVDLTYGLIDPRIRSQG